MKKLHKINKFHKINELVFSALSRLTRNTLSLSVLKLLKSVRKLINKEEKIVEHRNSGLMFGNLTCICKCIFHIFKNKTVSLV